MSWDAYCDSLAAQGLKSSCVMDFQGSIYAQKGDPLSAPQAKLLGANAKKPNQEQLEYGKSRFMFVRHNDADSTIFGKTKGGSNGGIVLSWTKKVVVVAVFDETLQGGPATKAVTAMRDFLRTNNY